MVYPFVVATIFLGAGAIFILNLAFTVAEIEQVRAAIPLRILRDDEQGVEG